MAISVARRHGERVKRATAIGMFVWLITGIALFSEMARLHPRYVESFTPAVAGCSAWASHWWQVVAGACDGWRFR